MPAGDAQRAWFPEMLEELKSHWASDKSWDNLANFCRYIAEERDKIRTIRGIKPPRSSCNKCGGKMVLPPISIRSALFALRKIKEINEKEFKNLDREWGKYRKINNLNAYGNNQKS